MRDYNKVILMGNLTRDPEKKSFEGGKQVTNFTIAVNRKWIGPEGQEAKEVSFIDCQSWGKQGETIATYFFKGNPIFIEGRLKQDTWIDKDTQKKQSRLRVVVDHFSFLDSKKSDESIPVVAGNDVCDEGAADSDFDAL